MFQRVSPILGLLLCGLIANYGGGSGLSHSSSWGTFNLQFGEEPSVRVLSLVGYSFESWSSPWSLLSLAIVGSMYLWTIAKTAPPLPVETRPAGVLRRTLAFVIDFIANVTIASISVGSIVLLFEIIRIGTPKWYISRTDPLFIDATAIIVVYLILLFLFALPIFKGKQSLGQLVMNMIIVAEKNLSLFSAVLRSFLGLVILATFIVSVPLSWLRSDRRMWHDLIFGTYPKRIPKVGKDG